MEGNRAVGLDCSLQWSHDCERGERTRASEDAPAARPCHNFESVQLYLYLAARYMEMRGGM